ncbi:MAG: hypothetical protein M3299_09120 [Thermoproteota archaeon]|nr:hypothetical protein [Thermoproteota archaeon]
MFQLYYGGSTIIQLAKIAEIPNKTVNLKHIALQLCTCTWIEIMTGAGIIFYMLYLGNYTLVAITMAVFAPLIGFHFAVSKVQQHSNVEWKNPRRRRTVKLRP